MTTPDGAPEPDSFAQIAAENGGQETPAPDPRSHPAAAAQVPAPPQPNPAQPPAAPAPAVQPPAPAMQPPAPAPAMQPPAPAPGFPGAAPPSGPVSAFPVAIPPLAPTPPATRKRGSRTTRVLVAALAGVLVLGGAAGAVFLILDSQRKAEIARQDDHAERVASESTAALAAWKDKLWKIPVPDPASIDGPALEGSTAADQAGVQAGCTAFANYRTALTEMPEAPLPAAIEPEVAQRVEAYQSASRDAQRDRAWFDRARSRTVTDLDQIAKFCAFYEVQAEVRQDIDSGVNTWKASLWKKGHREVRGNRIYTCRAAEGCLPLTSQWPALAPVFEKSFVDPYEKQAQVFRENCPFADQTKECEIVAAEWSRLAASTQRLADALRAKDSATITRSPRPLFGQVWAKIGRELNSATGGDYSTSGLFDPTSQLLLRGLRKTMSDFSFDYPKPTSDSPESGGDEVQSTRRQHSGDGVHPQPAA